MALKSKRHFFSGLKFSLKEGIKRNQITVINASVTVILIICVITVLLIRANSLQRRTVEESIFNLAGQTANEVQTIYLTYYDIVRTTSQIMKNYKNIEVDQRRAFINNIMLEILDSNPTLLNIYSLWKPDALDGMDAYYVNTPGTDETGQFISGYTREPGWIEQKAFWDYRYVLNTDYHDLGLVNGIISEPMPLTGRYRNSWVVDVQIPILADDSVVGIIGVSIDLQMLQFLVELKRPYGTGRTMVCTNRGTLVAHSDGRLRGVSFMAAGLYLDYLDPLLATSIRTSVFYIISSAIDHVEPTSSIIQNTMFISYPLRTLNPTTAAYESNESGYPRWAVVTAVPMETILTPINTLLRFSILFVISAAVIMVFVVLTTSRSLTQRAKSLQRDLEQASTMQENLKYGLFLMDIKYNIQGAYSKALEKILAVSNLTGKNFVELLTASIKPHEKDGLADYFDMILKKSFDKELLDSINPIVEFTYVNPEAAEVKNLHTSFTLAERGRGSDFILGTIEDITSEKELEKQLLEAENIRENEMRSLFQVIQLDPRVLSDFVADAEYEFDRINEMLKSRKEINKELLVDLFQSVHAVKSNALILNLESFSERLHRLETSVKVLQEKPTDIIPFDDFFGLIFEIDEAMKEIDSLKATVSKIENFKNVSGGSKNQERYVLIETLTRVCSKTQAALDKKVRLVVEEIDEAVLNYGPRRAIKEVLTQLVRNAVYHGIESPEERERQGKEAEGEIRISIRHRGSQVYIELTDNGNGIDFGKIRERAMANKLLQTSAETRNKNLLLKTIFSPGFSTLEGADFHAGRGIGLSLVKDRVREMHGNITVSTANGRGTTFAISIPMELPVAADNVS